MPVTTDLRTVRVAFHSSQQTAVFVYMFLSAGQDFGSLPTLFAHVHATLCYLSYGLILEQAIHGTPRNTCPISTYINVSEMLFGSRSLPHESCECE